MKETEEATLERLFKLYAEYSSGMAYKNIEQLIELSGAEGTKKLICSIAKDYHTERMKSSLPSEQEIDEKVKERFPLPEEYYLYKQPEFYKEGFKDALALLTKGGK